MLYHYATKQALLTAMLEHMIDLNQQRMENESTDQTGSGMLQSMLEARENMSAAEHRASQALLAAAAEDSELLDPARKHYRDIFQSAANGCSNPMAAKVLMLASEGLRFFDVVNVNPLEDQEQTEIVDYIHEQARRL